MCNPNQQLFQQHCLTATMLGQSLADRAVLAFVAPSHNGLAHGAAASCGWHLRDLWERRIPFTALSLEQVIAAIAAAGLTAQAAALYRRYSDFWLVDGELALDAVLIGHHSDQ